MKQLALRIAVVALGLAGWFFTQGLIALRPFPEHGLGDGIFELTAGINEYFFLRQDAANALLILSSLIIDALGVYLLLAAIFGPTIRPFLGLLMLFSLRQICQALCALPAPEGMIWRDPAFPTLLVTYGTASDFFFSGHTAIAVYGGTELARHRGVWIPVGISIAVFEAATVLVLRAHYTMDVFTAVITALWVSGVADKLAPYVDRWIGNPSATLISAESG